MKLSSFLLGGSIAANLVLAGILVFQPVPSSVNTAAAPAGGEAAAAGASTSARADAAAGGRAVSAGTGISWERLGTDDLAMLAPRLHAAGFPPAIVRRIIGTMVNEEFDRRRLAVEKETLESPLWVNTQNPYMDQKIGAEFRKLQREQMEMLGRLIGGSLSRVFGDTADNRAMLRHQIGDIPDEKIDRLYAAAMELNEKAAQIYAAANSGRTMLNADREKLMELERGFQEELGRFLTPAEVSDFMMHGSMTGSQLRQILGPFQPTEQEYRALFPVYQAFQQQFPFQSGVPTPEQALARKTAEEVMHEQVKGLLGAQRAADFKQAIDPTSNQVNRLVARLELPISAAAQVAAVQRDAQARARTLHEDRQLSAADRSAQLGALAQEASTKITAAIGARGLEAYKQYGGQWLDTMVPRSPPAPPKK